jgi:hypothetical protein
MKKLLAITSLVIFVSLSAFAQLRVGIRGGVSTTSLSPDDLNLLGEDGVEKFGLALENAKFGVHAGLVFQARFGEKRNFLIQPEILLNSNKAEFKVTDMDDPNLATQILEEKYQYLDIPLLLGFKFGPLRLLGGPVGHVYLNSSSSLTDLEGYRRDFDDLTLGWQAGLGIDIWSLMLDFRYEGNFTKFGNHIRFAGRDYEFDQSPSRFIFSAAILFGGGK